MKSFVQFGAGNIGRSFLGQLFSRAGYEVIFIDIAANVIDALNQRRAYTVVIKEAREEQIAIANVRGINAGDHEAVARAIAACDLMGTSVGKNALPHIMEPIARGLEMRPADRPLDIIIAENIHDGAAFFRSELQARLPSGFDLEHRAGLIETSIGKMVPIMKTEDRARDSLLVFAEKYNALILDRRGFRNPIPAVDGLEPKDNIKAYVDRKLFIHNLGHASAAYIGHLALPGAVCMYEVVGHAETGTLARRAMGEARDALLAAYPAEFSAPDLDAHIDDLLRRFANVHLGDTVFRVGRDLTRKLGRADRLTGGMLVCARYGLPFDTIALAAACAFFFKATDSDGQPEPRDEEFRKRLAAEGFDRFVPRIMALNADDTGDRAVLEAVRRHHDRLAAEGAEYLARLGSGG